ASDAQSRCAVADQDLVQPQFILIENEFRFEAIENAGKLIAVHLDMDRADGRSCRHDAEIAKELLDGIVGKKRDPIVRPDAAAGEKLREGPGYGAQSGVVHPTPLT